MPVHSIGDARQERQRPWPPRGALLQGLLLLAAVTVGTAGAAQPIPPLRMPPALDPTQPPELDAGSLAQGQDALVRGRTQTDAARAKALNKLAYELCRDAAQELRPSEELAAALLCQGRAALRLGDRGESVRLALESLHLRPNRDAHLLLGDGYAALGDCAQALPEYLTAIETECTAAAMERLRRCGATPPARRCPSAQDAAPPLPEQLARAAVTRGEGEHRSPLAPTEAGPFSPAHVGLKGERRAPLAPLTSPPAGDEFPTLRTQAEPVDRAQPGEPRLGIPELRTRLKPEARLEPEARPEGTYQADAAVPVKKHRVNRPTPPLR